MLILIIIGQVASLSNNYARFAGDNVPEQTNEYCTVVGWGTLSKNTKKYVPTLQKVQLEVVPLRVCVENLAEHVIPDKDMCLQSITEAGIIIKY